MVHSELFFGFVMLWFKLITDRAVPVLNMSCLFIYCNTFVLLFRIFVKKQVKHEIKQVKEDQVNAQMYPV